MIILIDNPQKRAELIRTIQAHIDREIEEIATAVCEGRPAERATRRLQKLTSLLVVLKQQE